MGYLDGLFSVAGKTALVTGGATGIGRMAATALAGAGACYGIVVNAAGTRVFVADYDNGTVHVLAVDALGALTPVAGSPFTDGGASTDVAKLSIDGAFLYVNDETSNPSSVHVYAVDATGALTPIAGNPFDYPETDSYAFGIEMSEIEAQSVDAVYEAAQQAVDSVRGEQRPYFLALRTYRLAPHSKGDDTRPESELERYRQLDPLLHMHLELAALDGELLAEIEAAVEQRLASAVDAARSAPLPDPQTFLTRMASW